VAAFAPFDVVVSGYSIHHQEDARKRGLYGEILALLRPGGVFLNLEHVASASAWGELVFDEQFVDALAAFHGRTGTGKGRAEVESDYVHRPDKAANRLAPVDLQCGWLRDLGFERVDCFFKVLELALFGGIRPGQERETVSPGERAGDGGRGRKREEA
jgi:SAM-dependent methyltransferase